jgi:peptide/nickel transport system permease protein
MTDDTDTTRETAGAGQGPAASGTAAPDAPLRDDTRGQQPFATPPRTYGQMVWHRYRKSALGLLGLWLVVFLGFLALFAPLLANDHPILCKYDGKLYTPALKEFVWTIPGMRQLLPKSNPFNLVTFDFERRLDPERGDWALRTPIPHGPNQTSTSLLHGPTAAHLLGTDEVGRDVLARMIYGARVSMLVGFVSVGISTLIGLLVGSLAGYFGSWVDIGISRIIEVVICFPVFFFILSIMAWFEPSIWNVMIVIGITRWVAPARYVRGEFIRLRETDFSVAARALGASNARIIFRHILPNALAPVFVTVTFGIASAILIEAGLSWLGFGVMPPQASWGNILRTAFDNIFTSSHMIYPPCIAIFIAVLSYNLVGDALRDAIDPRLSQ